jgi:hypothetical protein
LVRANPREETPELNGGAPQIQAITPMIPGVMPPVRQLGLPPPVVGAPPAPAAIAVDVSMVPIAPAPFARPAIGYGATSWRDSGLGPMRGATLGPIESSQHPGVGYGTGSPFFSAAFSASLRICLRVFRPLFRQ